MRPVTQRLAAAGATPWVTVNYLQNAFTVGLAVSLSSGAVLTAAVQYTLDDPQDAHSVSLSQTLLVVTVTDKGALGTGHGLSVGDSVVVSGSSISGANGTFAVASVVDANPYTYASAVSQSATDGFAKAAGVRVFTHATLTGLSARAAGSLSVPVQAVRFAITAFTSGFIDGTVVQGQA